MAAKQQHLLERLGRLFESQDTVDSNQLSRELEWDHESTIGGLKSLEMLGKVRLEVEKYVCYPLTKEGEEVVEKGSPEWVLLQRLPEKLENIKADETLNRGLAVCLKNKWVERGQDNVVVVKEMPEGDLTRETLVKNKEYEAKEESAALESLRKRKLVNKQTKSVFVVSRTEEFDTVIRKQLVDLDRQALANEEWKSGEFKQYNWNAAGLAPATGSMHPLLQTMNVFRNVLLQMNFEEMDSRRWVESSFWNFDALFQPQTHPVRDSHDTFFLKEPAMCKELGKDTDAAVIAPLENVSQATHLEAGGYCQRVKDVHQVGGYGSLGWQCPWSEEEASKLILRTHTTAVTTRILRYLALDYAQNKQKIERKFFSIDRVFRNETLDATHLAEFHQVEGIVVSQDASLAMLMGIISTFFRKIGITDVKFKPAYNPYTEPSMEIFGFHPTLGRWTEIGNSGVFRPEMLKPMGLPDDLIVLGWGLSLERPTMINYNVKDIRELIGPRAKLTVF